MKIVFFFSVLFLCFSAAGQQQFRFKNLSTAEGLTQGSVNDIFQDSQGYIWFATQDGLNQYDGYTFKHYLKGEHGLSDNFLWNILEDSLGFIWVGSRNGANRTDPRNGEIVNFFPAQDDQQPVGNYVTGITAIGDWVYLCFGNSIYKVDVGLVTNQHSVNLTIDQKVNEFLPGDNFHAVTSRRNGGGSYFLSNTHLTLVNSLSAKTYLLPDPQNQLQAISYSLLEADDASVWMGIGTKIYVKEPTTDQVKMKFTLPENVIVQTMCEVQPGEIWVGTSQGLYIVTNDIIFKAHDKTGDLGLISYSIIHRIYKDLSGLIWIGVANKGVFMYDPAIDQFKFLNKNSGLSDDLVWSIMQDEKGRIWVGTEKGLDIIQLKEGASPVSGRFAMEAIQSIKRLNHPALQQSRVTALAYVDQKYWIGTGEVTEGLLIYNEADQSIREVSFSEFSPLSNKIVSINSYLGKVWVATLSGLFVLDHDGQLTEYYHASGQSADPALPSYYFMDAYVGQNDLLWLGSSFGFCSLDGKSNKFTTYHYDADKLSEGPAFNFVSSFAHDGNGNLWLTTYGGGISRFDTKTSSFTHFNKNNGLANNVCSGLLINDANEIWVSTNKGLSRFSIAEQKFTNFGMDDGLPDNEFTVNSQAKGKNGILFFGTTHGLVVFDPKAVQLTQPEPAVRLTSLKLNYKNVPHQTIFENRLDIYPESKVVSFEFAALTYNYPEMNSYAYKMEGFDTEWVAATAQNRIATYSNLPSGNYIFMVKAANKDGLWSVNPLSIELAVHPPFWKATWFIGMVTFLVAAFGVVVVRYFAQRKLKQQVWDFELRGKIQEERERISRELHDNVGAQITHMIASIDHLSFKKQNNGADISDKLSSLSSFGRETMHQLRETIWVMNQNSISLEGLCEKVRENVYRLTRDLENLKTEVEIDLSDNVILKPAQAVNILRIVQEAVTNALKHASASRLKVEILQKGSNLDVIVNDNGIGISREVNKNGHFGLLNMRKRATDIEAKFLVESTPQDGTRILVKEIPLH